MNLISDGNFKGLRKLSILATSLVLLLFAGLLVLRRPAPTVTPEPRKSEYARYETEPKSVPQHFGASREEADRDRAPEKLATPPSPEKQLQAAKLMSKTSIPIVATAGGGPDRFALRDRNANAFFTDSGITFAFTHGKDRSGPGGHAVKWGLEDAKGVRPRPEGETATKVNRMIGDPSTWETGLPSYSQMVYDSVRPGVDMTIEARPQGVKYSLQVAPGADASNLKFRYEGATGVSVAQDGRSLQVAMGKDFLTESELLVWQETSSGRVAVDASYEASGADGYVIRVGKYDQALPLMVDPVVSWGTFLGGRSASGGSEEGYAVAADSGTNCYVGGSTGSVDFPTTPGAFQISLNSSQDGWVCKFNSGGGLVWCTLIGGTDTEYITGLKLDTGNNPVVCGFTYSKNYPTTAGTFQPTCPANNTFSRAFVTKFVGATGAVTWSTYVSGPGNTGYAAANGIALDVSNNVYITGYTGATDHPTVNAFQNTMKGGYDAFVTKLDPAGATILYSTYFGGGGYDYGYGIAVDASNNAFITGYTDGGSPAFPTSAGAYRTAPIGGGDAFAAKFNVAGGLAWSTLIGGTNYDVAFAIGVDSNTPASCYITGYTYKSGAPATDYPTTAGAYDTTHDATYDGFLTKINPSGTNLLWSTYIGGDNYDIMYGLVVSSTTQDVYVCGGTYSTNMPVLNGVDLAYNGGQDAYFCRFSPGGTFLYGSYLGGTSYESARAIGEYNGWVWVTGSTSSADFLLSPAPYQGALKGGQDTFVTRVDAFGPNILNWSTFIGGTFSLGSQDAYASAIDANGNVYVAGTTYNLDYPTTPGAIQAAGSGGTDIVISKIASNGASLLWSTYFGGATDEEYVNAIATNSNGEVSMTGYTYSTDYPTLTPGQGFLRGGADAFVTRFQNDGTLFCSTYIGGATSDEYGYGIAVDSSNNVYITGDTYSTDYYAINAYKPTLSGSGDCFLSKLNPTCNSLFYSTYLGGSSSEHAQAIAVDAAGAVYIAGTTQSAVDYPIVGGAYSSTFDVTTGQTPFVTKFTPAGTALQFSTYYGGTNNEYPYAIAVDNAQNVYVAGYTYSSNFPTPGGAQTTFGGNSDGYVVKFNPTGSNILWATFLGGSQSDSVSAIAVDSQQNVYCTGNTGSTNFPTTPPLLTPVAPGGGDAFAVRINAAGNTLSWSTYIGGTSGDYGIGIGVGSTGHVTVFGGTGSADFPVTGGVVQPVIHGYNDFFVVRINNEAPSAPSSLTQYRSNGTTVIATGGATNETTVVLKGISTDAEGDKFKLQVEVRPVGAAFTSPVTIATFGVDFFESAFVPSATTALVTVGGRVAGTLYHWQARSVDVNGVASAWGPYGANTENPPTNPAANDFRVDQAAPSIAITTPNGTGTYYTNLASVALGGTSGDNVQVFSVTWVNAANSLNGTASGTTTWSVPGVSLASGSNVITLTATDTAGNTNTAVINVIQDTSVPTITITGPTSNPTFITAATTTAAPNAVTGTYSDNLAVTNVTWANSTTGANGTAGFGGGTFTVPTHALNTGVNNITVTAFDNAGNSSVDTIAITSDPTAPAVTITGPTPASSFATSAASISLSGTASDSLTSVTKVEYINTTTTAPPPALATGTTSWSTPAILLATGNNVINVIATDAAGNQSTDTVTVIKDNQAPSIQITGPTINPTFITNGNSVNLAGTASDAGLSGLVSVGWTNGATGGFGTATGTTSWSVTGVGLASGANLITLTATDGAGNTATDTITVTSDPTPPLISITGPTSSPTLTTSGTTITLTGTASDSGGGAINTINWSTTGAVAPSSGVCTYVVGPPGTWSIPNPQINLAPGLQTITITATDTAGNSAFDTIAVTRDNTNPTLAVTTPAVNPFYTTAGTVALGGTASDASGITQVQYRVNGGGLITATGTTTWSVASAALAALPTTNNTIDIIATDGATNTTQVSITVIRDTINPAVSITTNGGANFSTNATPLALAGTSSDNFVVASVQWQNNGGGFNSATGTAPWSASIPLSAGSNAITVKATDAAGNSATTAITVTLDQTSPIVSITGPSSNPTFSTTASSVTISGNVSDAGGTIASVNWSTNGAVAPSSGITTLGAGTFTSTAAINLAAGAQTITVTATDSAGNTSTDSIIITRDNTNPTLAISTPGTNPAYTTSSSIALAGTASDNNGLQIVEYRVLPTVTFTAATGTTSWSVASAALLAGSNTIEVRATDLAGNTFTASTAVVRDNVLPVVTITTNGGLDFTTNSTPLALAGTSSDDILVSAIAWSNNGSGYTAATGTTSWSASIPLSAGTNTITVRATDAAGNISTDSITVTYDSGAPLVSITSPTVNPTYVTGLASVTLGGTASDASGIQKVEYRLVPGAFALANPPFGTWTTPAIALAVGSNTIEIKATDNGNNPSTTSIVVTRDTAAPTVAITGPTSNPTYATNGATLTLSGTVSDSGGGTVSTVTWNNPTATSSGGSTIVGGTWTATSTTALALGSQLITVTATDSVGNISTTTLTVVRDTSIPTITLVSPGSPHIRNTTPVTVTGTADDGTGSGVASVNWSRAEGGGATGTAGGTTSWTANVPLVVGTNTITFTAVDAAGNSSTGVVLVATLDQTAPTLQITGPTSNPTYATNLSAITLSGTVSDAGGGTVTSVTWSNPAGASSGGSTIAAGNWTATAVTNLAAGVNTITVTALDSANNSTQKVLTVTVDTTIPTIVISSPASPAVVGAPNVAVNGTASDGAGSGVASVTWSRAEGGGATGTATGTTAWNAVVPLVVGLNTITFKSVDAAANQSTGSVLLVTLDQTGPAVAITGPVATPTYATKNATLTLSGTVTDSGGGTVSTVGWVNAGNATSGTTTLGAGTWAATGTTTLVLGSQVITVTATDSVGNVSTTTLTVFYDNTNPTVAITSPTSVSPFTTGANPLTMGGSASDTGGSGLASVTWSNNGGPTSSATGLTSWSASIPLVTPGPNVITITATDNAGNTATASLTVFLNTTAPTVTITGPTTNSTFFTSAASIALGGTAIDSDGQIAGVAYTVNGGGSVAASGAFPGGTNTTTPWSVASISLIVGTNTIVVTATDDGATTGSDTITVIRDNTIPTVAVTTPGAANFTTNTSPVVLGGTASDLGGSGLATVTWTNAATSGTGPAGSASPWTGTVPLTPGPNLITFTATDNAGNTGTTSITVTYDVGAPVVTITSPSATGTYQTATTPLITLAGTSSDNVLVASVQYQINGGIFTPTGGTLANWSVASIALNSGLNTINVKATDSAGNTTTASIAVTLDNTNPSVTISSPTALPTYITNTTPIILAGTASDNLALASVTWVNTLTGGTGTATGTTAWTATGINLSPGVNPIQVKATDTLGNQSALATLNVTYDSSVPTLAITAPTAAATYLTTLAAVTLSGTAGDNIAVATVTASNSANGSAGTPSGTTAWSVTGIALVAGTNVITVTATDTAGNTTTKTLTVTRDNTLPTVAIATPTAGPTYLAGTSPVNLAGTASDNVGVASVQWSNSNGGGTGTATGTTSWTASVGLNAGSNVITVTATDTAGNVSVAAVLTVTYDAGAPTVSITTNGGVNFATNSSPAALAGTAADAQGIASVKWSNAATGGTGTATGTWSTSIPLAVGGNAITITATDNAGNTATALITITLDTTVPTVTITGPTTSPTYVTTGATIALNGTFADNISVASVAWATDGAVLPNSGAATLGAGTWTIASIDLAAGSQILTITATDSAGNTSTDTITVTRDNTIPTIAVTSPTGTGTYVTGAATLIIGGIAADDLSVAGVAWTRLEGGLSGAAAGTTTWSATVPLQAGTNTFTFTASDSAGNPSTGAVIVVTRDNTLPAVQITGPTPNPTYTTGASPIAISGTATDADGIASVTWFNAKTGGSAAASYAAGAWTASVPLAIGVNTITVSATDTAGNIATDAFDVTLDISPPVVTITSPTVAPTFVQSGASITLGGAASDNTGVVSVTALNSANGSVGTPSGTTAWTVTGITLVAGPNVITVTATDNAGNTASSVLTVTRDGTPPVIAITGPTAAPTYITNATPILLTGTSSDNVSVASISWSNSLGGSGAATGTAVWSASVGLSAGNNIITVTSTDTAGGTSTAVLAVTFDNTPPAVAITAPTAAPTYVTNIAPVLLGGTASDGTQLQDVTWSNAATGGSGTATGTTTWSASVPLTNGLNTITVSANDTAGNSTTAVIAVTFDATVPTVTITTPTALPNFLTSAATIALGGTASDNVGVATVTCVNAANGAIGVVTGTTSWTVAPIALAAGDNAITLTVTDTAGNTSSDTITVKQDSTAPVVLITLPNSSGTAVTNSSPLAIGGTASDNVGVASIAWSNPLGVPTSGTATGTTTWSALVPIAAGGPNTITITATDTAGNTSTATLTVSLDNTAPTISTTGPTGLPTYSTATSSVTVSGNASDAGGLSTITWVNGATGATGTATGTASWTAAIALTPGINVITITATDSAGNISTSTITVIHDTQSPTITISTPSSSANANSPISPITVGGSASDNVGVTTVTWTNGATGGSGTATGTTAWSTSVPLVEGNNQITVTAVDDVGNSSSDTITVTYDPTLPTINITSPTMQATFATTTTPLDFLGTASDNLVLTGVTWANVSTGTTGNATGTTTWSASVPLQSGVNTIVFTATDGVGNLVTDSIDVTYDVTPPVVVIVTPAPPTLTTQTRPLLISGTASDNIGVSGVTWSNSLTGASGAANFADPNWDASVPLIPGTNVITIRAIDALGNIGTATLTVDYSHETVVPTITIDTPTVLPTFTSPTQLVTVAGTASDNVGVTAVTWVNRTTTVYGIANGTTAWSADIPLADGINIIDVTASDDVGNTVFASITITFLATVETNPPTITITAPTTNDTFNTTVSPLHLEANAIDDVGVVSVHWTNQGTYGDGGSGWGTFWYATIPLVSGSNVITVTAVDTSGNTTTDTITVNYNPPAGDPVPPLVNIVTPLASGTVNTTVPLVSLTGTASDNNKVDSVTFSNSTTGVYATAAGTSSWSATNVVLDPGVNVITARAIDPAGNVGQATLVVVYTPPAAAKPVAPVIPAGMCGCTGLEPLLVIGALWLGRRFRRRSR